MLQALRATDSEVKYTCCTSGTEGTPLFMVTLLQHLLERGWQSKNGLRVETDFPEGLRQLIMEQLKEFSPDEQEVLAVGSVVRMEFTVTTVAAGLRRSGEEIEERCERLSREGSFIERAGLREWPGGAASGCYRFRHALHRQAVYEHLAEGRRVRLHRRIGQQIEAGYGARASGQPLRWGSTLRRGRTPRGRRGIHHRAAEQALRRSAYEAQALPQELGPTGDGQAAAWGEFDNVTGVEFGDLPFDSLRHLGGRIRD